MGEPAVQSDLLQIAKAVAAAILAWVLAAYVLGLGQPFLAPWTALLTVHATVYRTIRRGAQSVLATFLGVGLSYATEQVLGPGITTLAVALLLGMLLSRAGVLRDEGVTVATTALFVLTTGIDRQAPLESRVVDVTLGAAVGLLVNLLVLPPLSSQSIAQRIDGVNQKMGELMTDMAEQMRSGREEEQTLAWIERTRELDRMVDGAWQLVSQAAESAWWNPRPSARRQGGRRSAMSDILHRLEDGVAHLRALARTVDESTRAAQEWDPRFRQQWLALLAEVGVRVADPDAEVASMHARLDDLTRELSREDLSGLLWPVYGALISDLINLVDTVDDVASARAERA